ncbi:Nn.00g051540.m01.CDS01 [Neocucurbitaria sp. VM-36]
MRDLEQELRDTLAGARDGNGEPREGFLNLTRRMENEEEDQFDVDLTILDFLVYKAIGLVFEWRFSSDPYTSDLPNALVSMTADWRTVLKHRHHGRRLDSKAAFRSRLLQFALVFTHRLHHDETWTTEESLNELREQNESRGDYWKQRTSHPPALRQPFDQQREFPLSDGALYENRNGLASALNIPHDQRRWVTDVAGTPSLHCLLPLFIELTAARVNLDDDWIPTSEWFDLAGEFMLQAVIEEFLRNGVYGADVFNTVFAFGCPGVERWAEEPADVTAMRRLFCDENNPREQNRDWTNIKTLYINELLPQRSSQSSLQAIEAAQRRHPYSAFEGRLLSFLKYLHDGLVKPDLAQVEEGRINIDGNELSEADSREMIRRMGL